MAIEKFTIPGADSGSTGPTEVPMAQYLLNNNQQICVFGVNFDINPVEFGSQPTRDGKSVTSVPMGKLSELNFIMAAQCRNSLEIDGWDFETYPDPEVVLLDEE